jgi:hypothetical protein
MFDLTKAPPVTVDINLPRGVCVGCGTTTNVKQFGFKMNAWTESRQIIPFCAKCSGRVIAALRDAWQAV